MSKFNIGDRVVFAIQDEKDYYKLELGLEVGIGGEVVGDNEIPLVVWDKAFGERKWYVSEEQMVLEEEWLENLAIAEEVRKARQSGKRISFDDKQVVELFEDVEQIDNFVLDTRQ